MEGLIHGRRKLIVIVCDVKAEEERIKCTTECDDKNVIMKRNIVIKFGNEVHEKSISEVIQMYRQSKEQ